MSSLGTVLGHRGELKKKRGKESDRSKRQPIKKSPLKKSIGYDPLAGKSKWGKAHRGGTTVRRGGMNAAWWVIGKVKLRRWGGIYGAHSYGKKHTGGRKAKKREKDMNQVFST